MGTQDRKLHKVCRVEEHISTLLIRIYPLDLGTAHVRPVHDGLAGRERSLVEVTDNSSEKTVVAGRDAVMVIK